MFRRRLILTGLRALPLALGGLVYAKATNAQPAQSGYTCPVTGEELPCPNCCPLKK